MLLKLMIRLSGDAMGRFSKEYKFLDCLFKNEKEIVSSKWLEVIVETYEAAKNKNASIYEVAQRRFRLKEFYVRTCLSMFISPAKYFRLLRIFFRLAQKFVAKIFKNENRFSDANDIILLGNFP